MKLSIVVVFHNMGREAARTLYSLSSIHQRGVAATDYEVIAIDNGSDQALDAAEVTEHGPNFRYHSHATGSVSPAGAVNLGAGMASSAALAVIVHGAHMASPGLVRLSLDALRLDANVFVCARAWHLGPDVQNNSILEGYDQTAEGSLLAESGWRTYGNRLFEISTIAPSSRGGFLGPFPVECSWFAIPRTMFSGLGEFDTRFQSPGGGLCNHEFRNRAVAALGIRPISLLAKGVFHQVHGGASNNVPPTKHPITVFRDEHSELMGHSYAPTPVPDVQYFGPMNQVARRHLGP